MDPATKLEVSGLVEIIQQTPILLIILNLHLLEMQKILVICPLQREDLKGTYHHLQEELLLVDSQMLIIYNISNLCLKEIQLILET